MNLGLLQLSDSALPISGYTHSWGLEAAIARGLVTDAQSLENWTGQWLRSALGPFEGVLVAWACRSAGTMSTLTLAKLNSYADATIVPPSIRQASREMGQQLITLGRTWAWAGERLSLLLQSAQAPQGVWHHPVAFGVLGAFAGAAPRDVLAAYFHQAALGMIGAGVRAIPVGHTHGQQILAYLHDQIESLTQDIITRPLESAGAGCPYYEVLCDEQTQLYARMFRS